MTGQNDLVLITGATGYLGYLVLVEALKQNYNVRIAVRSESKAQKVLNAPSIKALKPTKDQLSWVIVPDMAAPGAYDEAVKDVKYIIHVASPIPTFGGPNPPEKSEYKQYFVDPAVAMNTGMVKSAAKEKSVKRVVLTSSAVAITPFEYYMGQGSPERIFKASDRIPFDEGPWEVEFQAYSAGKAAALNAAEAFVREKKPQFDLIPIIPGWIFGRNELLTSADDMKSESTNSVLLNFLSGGKNDIPFNGNMVLGDDVAKVHVLALNPKIEGNQSFLTAVDAKWEDALPVLKQSYPKAVADGKLSLDGKQGTLDILSPATETEKVFGIKFAPFERQVSAVVDQYLSLLA